MMDYTNRDRRTFLTRTASGIAACGWWTASAGGDDLSRSANERLRVGVIGVGVRGKYLIGNLPESAQVAAICDCAKSRIAETLEPKRTFAKVLAGFKERDARRCRTYQDYRRLLDKEKLDAVIIATPDHHHVPAAMRALKAGLDVYLEKPLTVTIREGRLLADLVKSTKRVLQVGSQQRTMDFNRFGCEFIRKGGLGRITKVTLPNYPGPIAEPKFPKESIPRGLDWNLFCGPSQLRDYNRKLWIKDEFKVGKLVWRGWDLFRDYSGHLMTNWGAHSVDMVQYALGRDDSGPIEIRLTKLKSVRELWQKWNHKSPAPLAPDDARFQPVVMRYADGVELHFTGGPGPIVFYGEKGRMTMRRNHFKVDPPELVKNGPDPKLKSKWSGQGHVARPHLENWIACIKSRKTPNAPVEAGHRTATICHLANLARELGRTLRWNPKNEQFLDDPEADKLLTRPRREGFALPG